MATGGKTGKAVAVSYDLMGNPIQVPQNQFDYNAQYAPQSPTNYNIDVGNGQWVNQGLNTGSNQQYAPAPPPYYQPEPASQAYSQNPDGSFAINANYINNNQTGGVRGFDAYGNYNQNTNRPYGYEGIYGTNIGQGNFNFEQGGEIKPSKAAKILHDGTINGKKITDKQRKYFGAMSNKAEDGTSFNNPFIDNRIWGNNYSQYQQPLPQMQSAPYQQLPMQQQMQGQQVDMPQYQDQGQSYSSIGSGIQSGVQAVGGLFSAANNLRNQVIVGGGALINGLLPDHHNIRQRSPVMADQTLAYQPQYNNMLENGGMLKMGDGGTIQVDSKNDPRFRAYQDNLKDYNYYRRIVDHTENNQNSSATNKNVFKSGNKEFDFSEFPKVEQGEQEYYHKKYPNSKWIGEYDNRDGDHYLRAVTPILNKPAQQVSVRPPLQPLPMQQIGQTPQGNMQGTPITWDNVTNSGVFPIYGQNNQLQGSWDRDKSGNTQYYPIQGQSNDIPNGLPSNTQVNPYPSTRMQNIHFENGGNMQQAGPVVNTAYLKGQTLDLSPQEVANLKKAGYTFTILE